MRGSDSPAAPDLLSASPMYAVNLQQEITYWGPVAEEHLAPAEDALGRHCYEVLADADPRNASRCRPNCRVVAMAREGIVCPDFNVWTTTPTGERRQFDVSILLRTAEDEAAMRIVHLVRCPAEVPAGRSTRLEPGDLGGPATRDTTLTPRQVEVLRLLAAGCSPDEIAETLGVRRVTVRNHVQSSMERLGARTRLEATMIAMHAGILSEPGDAPKARP